MNVSKMRIGEDYAKMMSDGPKPRGVGDNNRPKDVTPQMKNKVFQNLDEIYNNPVKSNHGAIYDSGTNVNGIPNNMDRIVNRGPFNSY